MKITTIGLDIAKQVFQVHAADAEGRVVLRKRLRRNQLAAFFANLPPCVAGGAPFEAVLNFRVADPLAFRGSGF